MPRRSFLLLPCLLLTACDRGGDPPATSQGSRRDRPVVVESDEEKLAKTTRAYNKVKDEIARLEQMVAASPGESSFRYDLGRFLVAGGLEERGLVELERALELDPKNVRAAVLLSKVLLQRNELTRATEILTNAKLAGDHPDLLVLEAAITLQQDHEAVARSIELLSRAVVLDPRHLEANYELAVLTQRTGDDALAESCLRVVVDRDPTHLGGHFNLARLLRKSGRDEEAEHFQAIHKRLAILETLGQLSEPETVTAYLGVSEVLQSGGDVEGALAEYDAGTERFPEAPLLRVRKALLLVQTGRVDEGKKVFELALRKLPDDPIVLNQFAWYLATRGTSDDERRRSLKLAERAVAASRREDPNVLDTLAEARAAMRDYAGADAALVEALRLKPEDSMLKRRREELAKRAMERP